MGSIRDVLNNVPGIPAELPPATKPCVGGCGTLVRLAWCKACLAREESGERLRDEQAELAPALESVPRSWRWSRLGAALLHERVNGARALIADVMRVAPWPNGVTILGAGGRGKTSIAVAILHAWIESRVEIPVEERKTARFVSARMLPLAKGEHAAGRGGSEYMSAITAAFVVLDDLGSEGDMPHARAAVADVLAERFAWERPTVVTTFLEEPAIRQRYGDGIARRMFERPLVLNLGGLA